MDYPSGSLLVQLELLDLSTDRSLIPMCITWAEKPSLHKRLLYVSHFEVVWKKLQKFFLACGLASLSFLGKYPCPNFPCLSTTFCHTRRPIRKTAQAMELFRCLMATNTDACRRMTPSWSSQYPAEDPPRSRKCSALSLAVFGAALVEFSEDRVLCYLPTIPIPSDSTQICGLWTISLGLFIKHNFSRRDTPDFWELIRYSPKVSQRNMHDSFSTIAIVITVDVVFFIGRYHDWVRERRWSS